MSDDATRDALESDVRVALGATFAEMDRLRKLAAERDDLVRALTARVEELEAALEERTAELHYTELARLKAEEVGGQNA